jgi:hypothetical protein
MLDGRAESTLCGVTGLYVVDFGGGEQERARREAEREAERRRLAVRYAVPIMEGEVIAQGAESDLGAAPVDHIAFVVRTIRDHLRGVGCEHRGAGLFCPVCGQRTGIGS